MLLVTTRIFNWVRLKKKKFLARLLRDGPEAGGRLERKEGGCSASIVLSDMLLWISLPSLQGDTAAEDGNTAHIQNS